MREYKPQHLIPLTHRTFRRFTAGVVGAFCSAAPAVVAVQSDNTGRERRIWAERERKRETDRERRVWRRADVK